MSKFCNGCGQEREIEEFWKNRNSLDGRNHKCMYCMREYERDYASRSPKEYVVYGLECPEINLIRYIGCSSQIKRRFIEHINCSDGKPNDDKILWIQDLKSKGLSPKLIILDHCNDMRSMFNREISIIKEYRDNGFNLLNKTDGGDGTIGFSHSQETRLLLAKKSKGRIQTEDGRARISKAKTGNKNPCFKLKGNPKRKLTFEDAERARELYGTGKYTYTDIAKMFSLNVSSMIKLINKESYKTPTKHNTHMRKLTMEQAQDIRKEYAESGIMGTELARKYNCTSTIIHLILKNKQYKY